VTDVIIVGAGPAGASLAVALGRQGLEVELYEQATFPRDKPCGEGLLPAGVRVLRSLELETAVAGEPLWGVRHHVAGGSVRSAFDGGDAVTPAYGIGQKRLHLDAILWTAAKRTRGVYAREGARVETVVMKHGRITGIEVDGEQRHARLVVAADGSSSTLRRKLGLERVAARRRVGIRAHFRRPAGALPLTDIEVFLRRGYELYVTPLPHGELLVAALAYQDLANGDLRGAFGRWLTEEPLLRLWLDGAAQTSELMGRAPLVSSSRGKEPPGLLLLGDAAASVDPITAGGLSLALQSAELLAEHAPNLLSGSVLARRRFERARARAVQVHRWLGSSVLALAARPRAAELARRGFHAYPNAMRALLDLAGNALPRIRLPVHGRSSAWAAPSSCSEGSPCTDWEHSPLFDRGTGSTSASSGWASSP
jgi:menaquinone-9 beta-reductase